MTREEIIRLAQEADKGFTGNMCDNLGVCLVGLEAIERFAALVAAAEREECAKVCLEQVAWEDDVACEVCAAAIRARGSDAGS